MISSVTNFESFTEAYLSVIHDILSHGEWVEGVTDPSSIGSNFGKKITRTKELLVYSFCVQNPRTRQLGVKNRAINKPFALANFLWILLGTKNADTLITFNQKGKPFLNNNGELHSAIGPHVFKLSNGVYLELDKIESLLRHDPTTRRAVIQFFNQSDLVLGNKDVPCFNHIQFFLRGKRLHCHVVMRSQSALMVLPYDFFVFSLLLEAVSVRLNVQLGKLYYTCNSLHIYENEIYNAMKVSKNDYVDDVWVMSDFGDKTINELKELFISISKVYREYNSLAIENIIHNSAVGEYWKHLLKSHFVAE